MPSTKSFSRIVGEKSRNVVWFASDCLTDSRREDYVKEMQKYIDVDVYGSCGNRRCYPSQSFTCYSEILKNYRFYLSFENAICTDYVTEKFFNAFNFDIVPVVMGALDYSLLIPKNSFINALHYPEPKMLAETLLKIASNNSEYIEFLKNKALFKAFLDPWMCRLCDRLHSYTEESILKDVEKWFFGDADCKEWNNTLRTYTDKRRSKKVLPLSLLHTQSDRYGNVSIRSHQREVALSRSSYSCDPYWLNPSHVTLHKFHLANFERSSRPLRVVTDKHFMPRSEIGL
ncbi:glycoprotein 3-alpha-L-fucosyltransferase A [Caerostris extrusa]|uniref:Fucosyltransferase n=1 Tax=Caerostris extrusa TaxID=172846 RepID=A0AAV4QZJ8_CAEEX|nr:glycoprotein 3-alpha-L-fucosyltransferase A [Caerostris extrusa]